MSPRVLLPPHGQHGTNGCERQQHSSLGRALQVELRPPFRGDQPDQVAVLLQVGVDERAVGQHPDTTVGHLLQRLGDETRAEALALVRVVDLGVQEATASPSSR